MSKQSSYKDQNSENDKSKIKAQIEEEERIEDERMIQEYKKDRTKDKLVKQMFNFHRNSFLSFVLWEIMVIIIFYRRMVKIPQIAYNSNLLNIELSLEFRMIDFRLQSRRLEMMASGLYIDVS